METYQSLPRVEAGWVGWRLAGCATKEQAVHCHAKTDEEGNGDEVAGQVAKAGERLCQFGHMFSVEGGLKPPLSPCGVFDHFEHLPAILANGRDRGLGAIPRPTRGALLCVGEVGPPFQLLGILAEEESVGALEADLILDGKGLAGLTFELRLAVVELNNGTLQPFVVRGKLIRDLVERYGRHSFVVHVWHSVSLRSFRASTIMRSESRVINRNFD